MMDLSPISHEPMRPPAPLRLLAGSIICALILNLLPWSGALLRAHPDFVLLVLLYWSVNQPRSIGQGWGFSLGLLMDVADSVLLGQHALVYVVAIYLAQLLRLRILQLSLLEQALHIGAILILAQAIVVLLNLSLGREFPGMLLALSPVLAAALWLPMDFVATLPRFRRSQSPTTMMR
jgi:rod shape-determining protein MreD